MLMSILLSILGWGGSALLVISLLQSRMVRLRVMNLGATVALTLYNAFIGVWPMAVMNAAVAGINLFYLYLGWARPKQPAVREVSQE